MKYEVLEVYRQELLKSLRPDTARTYFNRLEHLLEGQSLLDTIGNLDIPKILDSLSKIKYKNEFSQSKNALLYFLKFHNISLSTEQQNLIKHMERQTKKKYRKIRDVNFKKVASKVNHLRNQKLKLSYQTLMNTGLRVFEISQIKPPDCTATDNEIHFHFIGKGGNKEKATLLKKDTPKLYENLRKKVEETPPDKKVFYSAIYLQKKAKEIGFTCHDLRRIYAKLEYNKGTTKNEVRKKLRHSNIKTTDIYLKSRVKF